MSNAPTILAPTEHAATVAAVPAIPKAPRVPQIETDGLTDMLGYIAFALRVEAADKAQTSEKATRVG